jgi:hypothetical protein
MQETEGTNGIFHATVPRFSLAVAGTNSQPWDAFPASHIHMRPPANWPVEEVECRLLSADRGRSADAVLWMAVKIWRNLVSELDGLQLVICSHLIERDDC